MEKSKKILLIISWILFGITSSFIIAESCIPSDKSGNQSQFLSRISANIVNFFSRQKKVKTANPTSISVKCEDLSVVVDDIKTSIVNENKAIIGATKLFTYDLEYPNKEATCSPFEPSGKYHAHTIRPSPYP